MSGHNKWSQIKNKKAVTDQKKAKAFTKILAAVQAAAKTETNPDFNPQLRAAVQKAKDASVPMENITRAINRAKDEPTDELLIEAYGPEGSAFIIKAITNNRNRTMHEVKKLLSDNEGKFAEQGSVQWAFSKDKEGEWTPTFEQALSEEGNAKVMEMMEVIDDHPDVMDIYTNAAISGEDEQNEQ